ncbi:MAG: GNAT family N-acetyltransferase [Gammaproteobacteria bacterium]|uniref:Putative acetyltransferase n=1 Tax=viral metagenome TaxID=1070528 RepID=A0A6H1ZB12_9ZZZZ|nr:GNAT family N-acetyltransferase [Gammaproteobacteria bacterium]
MELTPDTSFAQLQLPFDLPLTTQQKRRDRLQERLRSSNVSVSEFRDLAEVEALMQLSREYAAECDPDAVFDEIAARVTIASILNQRVRDYTNCFIVRKYDVPVGFALVSVLHSMYSADKYGNLDWWYVLPQHRGSRATLSLLMTFEEWARHKGAHLLFTGSRMNLRHAARTISTLTKLGYSDVGQVLVKEA